MSGSFDRRQFLQTTAAGLGFWVAGGVGADERKTKLNLEKLNFACIGIKGKGDSDADHAADYGNIVAICDIDDKYLDQKLEQVEKEPKKKRKPHPKRKPGDKRFIKAQKFNDFRELLARMGDT